MSNPAGHLKSVRVLYKTILRLHRGLPEELQSLGHQYVRDEFKRHKTCNPAEAAVFMQEWRNYAVTLAEQLGVRGPKTASKFGRDLEEQALDKFRDDQIAQLYELMLAAKNIESEEDKKS
ncbi:unnamed protein product [Bemisia tabaci]|uniref:Succinate dehydrogenase assembly factor 3 n=1 Tax=Bemisia tabaci TaxID=7038 RepID=A0A9P0F4Q9_BEMTA|nr:PREDICTED: succinate dehydrogenase assembly factor 3, mitochondrial [Bemisia tabaci]CAH0388909.1 unnamed protein product [Bemisia tabaci]